MLPVIAALIVKFDPVPMFKLPGAERSTVDGLFASVELVAEKVKLELPVKYTRSLATPETELVKLAELGLVDPNLKVVLLLPVTLPPVFTEESV